MKPPPDETLDEPKSLAEELVREKSELDGKIKRLKKFVQSPEWDGVNRGEQERLARQYTLMLELSELLGDRIKNCGGDS